MEESVVDMVLRRALKDPEFFLKLYRLYLKSNANSFEGFIGTLRKIEKRIIEELTKK